MALFDTNRSIRKALGLEDNIVHTLTPEQRKYIEKVIHYVDTWQAMNINLPKEWQSHDVFFPPANTTMKRATLNRILKRGEYNDGEKEYLNTKLRKIYKYFKDKEK